MDSSGDQIYQSNPHLILNPGALSLDADTGEVRLQIPFLAICNGDLEIISAGLSRKVS